MSTIARERHAAAGGGRRRTRVLRRGPFNRRSSRRSPRSRSGRRARTREWPSLTRRAVSATTSRPLRSWPGITQVTAACVSKGPRIRTVDRAARPEPSAARACGRSRSGRRDAEQVARLQRPGELAQRRPAEPAGEDVLERVALARRRARRRRGPRSMASPPRRRRSGPPARRAGRQVDPAGAPSLDLPGERAQAVAVGRAPSRCAVDRPAGADRVAVAGLEIRALQPPGQVLAHAREPNCRSPASGVAQLLVPVGPPALRREVEEVPDRLERCRHGAGSCPGSVGA